VIVSHRHRFIFVKTRKTAGTSIEVLLARHAGPDAIVTPVQPPVPGHAPRNHRGRFNPLPQIAHQRRIRPALSDLRRRRAYWNHMPAVRIRERVGTAVWDSYFKFCFERDPWDKVVSLYRYRHWKYADTDFADFVRNEELPNDFPLYSLDGENAMDFVGRFEHLTDDLATVLAKVGIDAPVELTREKGASPPAVADTAAEFTPELDARVAEVFAREIAELGYADRSLR
jgi:hypothetical protein